MPVLGFYVDHLIFAFISYLIDTGLHTKHLVQLCLFRDFMYIIETLLLALI